MKPPPPALTPVQLDELQQLKLGIDHYLRAGRRNAVRTRLEKLGLIAWVVDKDARGPSNLSGWRVTAAGRELLAGLKRRPLTGGAT